MSAFQLDQGFDILTIMGGNSSKKADLGYSKSRERPASAYGDGSGTGSDLSARSGDSGRDSGGGGRGDNRKRSRSSSEMSSDSRRFEELHKALWQSPILADNGAEVGYGGGEHEDGSGVTQCSRFKRDD